MICHRPLADNFVGLKNYLNTESSYNMLLLR